MYMANWRNFWHIFVITHQWITIWNRCAFEQYGFAVNYGCVNGMVYGVCCPCPCPCRCSICQLILLHTRNWPPAIASLLIFILPIFMIQMCNGSSLPVCNLYTCPIFRIRPLIALLLIFILPLFRIQTCNGLSLHVPNLFTCPIFRIWPPNALLFVFCFPYTWIVTQNPTTLSPPCQTQSSRYHIFVGWLLGELLADGRACRG